MLCMADSFSIYGDWVYHPECGLGECPTRTWEGHLSCCWAGHSSTSTRWVTLPDSTVHAFCVCPDFMSYLFHRLLAQEDCVSNRNCGSVCPFKDITVRYSNLEAVIRGTHIQYVMCSWRADPFYRCDTSFLCWETLLVLKSDLPTQTFQVHICTVPLFPTFSLNLSTLHICCEWHFALSGLATSDKTSVI